MASALLAGAVLPWHMAAAGEASMSGAPGAIDSAQTLAAQAMTAGPTPLAHWLVIIPVVLPLLAGALAITLRAYPRAQPVIALVTMAALIANGAALLNHVAGGDMLVMTMGDWLPPFGISFAVDGLGAVLALAAATTGFLAVLYATATIDPPASRAGFYAMLLVLIAGVDGAFLTGDVFNLYVWFEVFVIASFGLMILGGEPVQLDGAIRYCFLNLIATTIFLLATAYLYGLMGTLNMADLSQKLAASEPGPRLISIAFLFLAGFGMKAASFPLYFWLPASYHTPKPVVSALFGGLLTKVGVYALLRTFTIIIPVLAGTVLLDTLYVIAIITIVIGLLGALSENNLRRMLGYLLISGVGVMLLGLALHSETALTATIFYAVHSIAAVSALYLIAGVIERRGDADALSSLRGFYGAAPMLAGLFLLLGFAQAGLPPLSGFWPKALLIKTALGAGAYWAVGILIANGLLGTLAIARAWSLIFWRPAGQLAGAASGGGTGAAVIIGDAPDGAGRGASPADETRSDSLLLIPIAIFAVITLGLGLWPAPLLDLARTIAAGLLDPSGYIHAVLGGTP